MPTPLDVLGLLDADRFQEILSASPKKFREELFRRAGIKVKSDAFSLRSSLKKEGRVQKLHDAVRARLEIGDDAAEELIRNYLYTKRPMLADALDHFRVTHDNGLTDSDLSFIETLAPEQRQELHSKLAAKHDARDVDLYFAFMNIPSPE